MSYTSSARLVEHAHRVEPPQDVPSPVDPRHPGVASHGEGHRPTGGVDLLGQLDSGGGGAHHQDASLGELTRVAVDRGDDLSDVGGQPGPDRRDVGDVAVAGGDDHVPGLPGSLVRVDLVPVRAPLDPLDGGAGADRRPVGVPLQVVDDLGHGHVAVGVGSLVGLAGQPGLPAGGQKAQRVPPLGAPALGHPSPLEDHVVDAPLGQAVAHRQARLPAADDDRVGVGPLHRGCSLLPPRAGRPSRRIGRGRPTAVALRPPPRSSRRGCRW